jgi:hypothetical protein
LARVNIGAEGILAAIGDYFGRMKLVFILDEFDGNKNARMPYPEILTKPDYL